MGVGDIFRFYYNQENQLIRQETYSADTVIQDKIEYIYTQTGKPLNELYLYIDNSVWYEYDKVDFN